MGSRKENDELREFCRGMKKAPKLVKKVVKRLVKKDEPLPLFKELT